MTSDGFYVGICWGTSDRSGNGIGLFTPLKTVRRMNEENGYGWLNDVGFSNLARKLQIIDRNNPQQNYPKDYILAYVRATSKKEKVPTVLSAEGEKK